MLGALVDRLATFKQLLKQICFFIVVTSDIKQTWFL